MSPKAQEETFFLFLRFNFLCVLCQNVFCGTLVLVFFNSTSQLEESANNISDVSLWTVNCLKCGEMYV